MRICHVASALRGGPLTSIRHLVDWQLKAGHDVSIVYSSVRDQRSELRSALPAKVNLVPWAVGREIEPRDISALIALTRTLRSMRPDILHLHSSKAGFHGRIAGRLLHLPNVYSPRGLSYLRQDVGNTKRRLYRALEYAGGLIGGPVVACSDDEYAALSNLPIELHLIPNAINLGGVSGMIRATGNSPPGQFHVAMVGRITAQRAPERVNEIASTAPPNWRFSWIGDGELRSQVSLSRVDILGWQPRAKVIELLSQTDVLLHPSLWEGMPNAVIEAMALGIPVVASDIVGNRSLIRDGETGYLIGDDQDYLPALRRLAADVPLREQMGMAGRRRISAEFDIDVTAVRWQRLYEETIFASRARNGRRKPIPGTSLRDSETRSAD